MSVERHPLQLTMKQKQQQQQNLCKSEDLAKEIKLSFQLKEGIGVREKTELVPTKMWMSTTLTTLCLVPKTEVDNKIKPVCKYSRINRN